MRTHDDRPWKHTRTPIAGLLAVAIACGAAGCGRDASERSAATPRAPLVVIGIDGAEWSVIRRLWAQGRLPHLRRLASEGTTAVLGTAYGASPVIWTTIATGRTPEEHGITDFVVTTPAGAVPVSSAVRRVPALWNMASRAGRRTAVVGWWASWPAEDIRGVVVSDRAHLPVDRAVSPAAYAAEIEAHDRDALPAQDGLAGRLPEPDAWMEDGASRDRLMAREARALVAQPFDLVMVYFRTVDIASHRYWKYYEPERYPGLLRRVRERWAHVIPTVYEATDRMVGEVVAACPPGTNVMVMSDHGFLAGRDEPFVFLNTERLLEHLGFLARKGEKVDFARSVAYPVDSPGHARVKLLRLSRQGREADGRVSPADAPRELDRLARALAQVRYRGGAPVFRVRRSDLPPQADLAAEVEIGSASLEVTWGGRTYRDIVEYINTISGTHGPDTDGVFVGWGPDVDSGARLEGLSVHDIAPTVLYALGLPVGADFAGRPRTELFRAGFRARHPVRTVPSWGTQESWKVETSPVDRQLLDELRALGYVSTP
jgi:predicted AlkP superfamily phosphohydrolase/phosphomutase